MEFGAAVGPAEPVLAAGMAVPPGQAPAAAELVLGTGGVAAVQTLGSGLPVIVHSAAAPDGGPLTDRCGRLVGLNVRSATPLGVGPSVGYAIAAPALRSFLAAHGVTAAAEQPCAR